MLGGPSATNARMRSLAIFYAVAVSAIVAFFDANVVPQAIRDLLDLPLVDKFFHVLFTTGIGFFAASYPGVPAIAIGARRVPLTVPLVFVLATLEEISQRWFPGRTFDLRDLAANFVGLALGVWLALARTRSIQPTTDH